MTANLRRALDVVRTSRAPRAGRLTRKHVLMLALAIEVLGLGICYADRYRPAGVTVEQPIRAGHAIA